MRALFIYSKANLLVLRVPTQLSFMSWKRVSSLIWRENSSPKHNIAHYKNQEHFFTGEET